MTRMSLAVLALLLLAGSGTAARAAGATNPPTSHPPAASPPAHHSVVFFRSWSARLSPAALAVVAGAAQRALADRAAQVSVVGAADPDGSAAANRLLARLRAQVVADALALDGVAASRIAVHGLGAVPFSQSGIESRRAIITVGRK